MSSWKSLFWIFLLAALPVAAQTNQPPCCRFPVRGFGSANVNLTPLIAWWSRQQANLTNTQNIDRSSRPMVAWKRILGHKTGDSEYGWFVDAEIFTNATQGFKTRLVLKNPPIAEEQAFYTLKQQIAANQQQITNAQQEYHADLKEEQRARKRAQTEGRSWHLNEQVNAGNNARQSAQKHDQAQMAQITEAQAKQSLDTLQKELAAIPSEHGRYQIDFFALETGKFLNGVPIYDLGVVYYPPQ